MKHKMDDYNEAHTLNYNYQIIVKALPVLYLPMVVLSNGLSQFLQIFKNKTIDMLVVAACLARNGFEIGCCSDEIIEVRTNLSPDSIQQSFKRLAREGIFLIICM